MGVKLHYLVLPGEHDGFGMPICELLCKCIRKRDGGYEIHGEKKLEKNKLETPDEVNYAGICVQYSCRWLREFE